MPAVKRMALAGGLVLLAVIWLGPLLDNWRSSFTAGMMAHMGVVAIASPLIAIGLPDSWRPGPAMPLAVPAIASLLEMLVIWGWHAPSMRVLAEASTVGTVIEQASFVFAGVLLWVTAFAAPDAPRHAAVGAGALFLTSLHMTLLGVLLALSPRPLYGEGDVTCFGIVLSASIDQQLGGVLMLVVGAVVYLAAGVTLIARLVAPASSHR